MLELENNSKGMQKQYCAWRLIMNLKRKLSIIIMLAM